MICRELLLKVLVSPGVKWPEPSNTEIYAVTETRSYVLSVT